jgi:hypothetical protein
MTATYTFDVFSSLDGFGAASAKWTGYWGKQGPELLSRARGRSRRLPLTTAACAGHRRLWVRDETDVVELPGGRPCRCDANSSAAALHTSEAPTATPSGAARSHSSISVVSRGADAARVRAAVADEDSVPIPPLIP